MDRRVIAIDGPSGAGKSSVSKRVGKELGFLHVDSGALYRIMTWQCLVRGVDTSDPVAVAACAAAVEVECRPENGAIAYYVGGEPPGDRIRTPEINAHASPVATVKEVRDRITACGGARHHDGGVSRFAGAFLSHRLRRGACGASPEGRGGEGHREPVSRGREGLAPCARQDRLHAQARAATESGRCAGDRLHRPHA